LLVVRNCYFMEQSIMTTQLITVKPSLTEPSIRGGEVGEEDKILFDIYSVAVVIKFVSPQIL